MTRLSNPAPIGKTFGRLTVISEHADVRNRAGKKIRTIHCVCACGNEIDIRLTNLSRGDRSCGCGRADAARERLFKHGAAVGGKLSPEYASWRAAKQRCFDKGHDRYPWYGGRGITMAAEWRNDFQLFLAHIGPKPRGWTLERIDNEKGYVPGNVKWASRKEQAQNRRPRKQKRR